MRASAKSWKKRARRQARFLRAYARAGTISAGARAAGVPRRIAQDWIDSDPSFPERLRDMHAAFTDYLQERMLRLACLGDGVMLRFIAQAELRQSQAATPDSYSWDDLERDTAEEPEGSEDQPHPLF